MTKKKYVDQYLNFIYLLETATSEFFGRDGKLENI